VSNGQLIPRKSEDTRIRRYKDKQIGIDPMKSHVSQWSLWDVVLMHVGMRVALGYSDFCTHYKLHKSEYPRQMQERLQRKPVR
jgi:hypothetical protein